MRYPNWMRKHRIMNIEQKIRNERASFDDVRMPAGSRERFEARLNSSFRAKRSEVEKSQTIEGDFSIQLRSSRNDRNIRFMTWTSVAAAAVTILMVISGMITDGKTSTKSPQVADNKLVEMRQFYDEKMDEAILNLEEVMKNVDDSTRIQINAVIDGLLNMGDVFAEMAPLPEEKQMAIAEQMYDNKLRTIELITNKINK